LDFKYVEIRRANQGLGTRVCRPVAPRIYSAAVLKVVAFNPFDAKKICEPLRSDGIVADDVHNRFFESHLTTKRLFRYNCPARAIANALKILETTDSQTFERRTVL